MAKRITSSPMSNIAPEQQCQVQEEHDKPEQEQLYGIEKGYKIRQVVGASRCPNGDLVYAVDYMPSEPVSREYVPASIVRLRCDQELIAFFQRKIRWENSLSSKKKIQ